MAELDDIYANFGGIGQSFRDVYAQLGAYIAAQTPPVVTPPPVTGARPYFAVADWLWGKIPANPVLDPKSALVATDIAQGNHKLAVVDFGVTIRTADLMSTRTAVKFSKDWGANPHNSLPMPLAGSLIVPPGGFGAFDGHTVVIDRVLSFVWSLWQAADGGRTASWGSVVELKGDGTEPGSMTSTGSKLSRLAGVITEAEMAAGVIPHALFMSCKLVGSGFRYPAGKSDQSGTAPMQEGMRLQLDPAVDISKLSKASKIIAKAMQDYGIYVGDGGGTSATIICEYTGSISAGYRAAGVTADFQLVDDIPWGKCRTLRKWDGT